MYRPNAIFSTPLVLLIPTYTTVQGVKKKTYPTLENGILFNGSFKSFGGTDRDVNGIYAVEDTASIETWFMPEITSECRIAIAGTNATYEILGEPENIEMRNQFIRIKVSRVKGRA